MRQVVKLRLSSDARLLLSCIAMIVFCLLLDHFLNAGFFTAFYLLMLSPTPFIWLMNRFAHGRKPEDSS